MERDGLFLGCFVVFLISTHTLTWSVTICHILQICEKYISTHTLTWSVTVTRFCLTSCLTISTHTLTWSVTSIINSNFTQKTFQLTRSRGAWQSSSPVHQWYLVFQLTRSRGAWPGVFAIFVKFFTFQLTRSRGAWLFHVVKTNLRGNFNSHAHVERDYRFSTLALYYANFNSHAHVERDLDKRTKQARY